jgi:hypothetical protein
MGFLDRFRPPSAEPPPALTGGVRAAATIERVVITDRRESREGLRARDGSGSIHPIVALIFRVAVAGAPEVICERRLEFPTAHIPAPGTTVPVSYAPGLASTTIDVVRETGGVLVTDLWEPPDPSVPRGWSGGVFDVPALGSEGGFPLSGHGIEADRELFRTGRRTTARIVASANTGETEQTAWERVLKLKLEVDGREVEVTTWTPGAIWPDTGDLIEVASTSDGSRLALDTDERWDGLPGRALVFRTGGALAAEPSAVEKVAATASSAGDPDGLLATLDAQLATMKLSRDAMGKRYERGSQDPRRLQTNRCARRGRLRAAARAGAL